MNWKYVSTYNGDNVTTENIKSKSSVFVAGIMAVLSVRAKSKFLAGVATAEATQKSNYTMKKNTGPQESMFLKMLVMFMLSLK